MNKISSSTIVKFTACLGLFSAFYTPIAFAAEEAIGLSKIIADSYIRSFPSEVVEEVDLTKDWNVNDVKPPKLADSTTRFVVFNSVFSESEAYAAFAKRMSPILNQYAWADLKLFYGSTSAPRYHLMTHINKTSTVLGEGVLASLLVTPVRDLVALRDRQNIVKKFVDRYEDAQKLKVFLKEYQEVENSLFSLWTPSDPLYTKDYKNYMQNYFYAEYGSESNKRSGWLEFKKRVWRDFFGIQYRILYPIFWRCFEELTGDYTAPGDPYGKFRLNPYTTGFLVNNGGFNSGQVRSFYWIRTIPVYGGIYAYNTVSGIFDKRGGDNSYNKMRHGIYYATQEVLYCIYAYTGIKNYFEFSSVLRSLALRMADIQAFVKLAAQVSDYVAANPELETIYSSRLAKTREMLARANEDGEFGTLMRYLQTLPYRSWSYFFNNSGKLLASHILFTEYKDEFADAMFEVGQLDAYLSVATLVKEAKDYNPDHCFTFTAFLDRNVKDRPYVKLKDMWNPFLDSKIAVGNDLEMDATDGGVRNITLTGPNAGGKSTFLTGVTHSILLSQSFGIAPAKEAVITPFDKINTYIDIMDDIAAGKSLFMAEVDRAQKHINLITGLKANDFSFTIFDEPFSGTNPTEGAAAEYSILNALADYVNTLNIVATHYPIVMLLEERSKHKGFANYKVYITQDDKDKKKINYTYKVIPGRSTQAIAIDILEQQGYDIKLLKRAREIIEHPERYKANFDGLN